MSDAQERRSQVEIADANIWASVRAIGRALANWDVGKALRLTAVGVFLTATAIGGVISVFTFWKASQRSVATEPVQQPPDDSTNQGQPQVVVTPPPRPQPRPQPNPYSYIDRYIDRAASGVAGKTNVALHIIDPIIDANGRAMLPIEGAAQSVLRERGVHVVPLFRQRFAQDGLDRELFRGSTSLASKLQLNKHCDSVLLGVVRIEGPPRSVQGLVITEAAFSLRKISAADGTVGGEWIIREKGGGADAESSAANALRRLEDSIRTQMAEWTLI